MTENVINKPDDYINCPTLLYYLQLAIILFYIISSIILVITVPYHTWDAFIYGEWSRLIAEKGDFIFRNTIELMAHRPLFYFLQGWTWRIFGFDEKLGRMLAFAFTIIFIYSIFRLAYQRKKNKFEANLAIILLFSCQSFAQEAFSGLTDVPVAGLLALVGMLLWCCNQSISRCFLLIIASTCAGLSKPSAFPSLLGLSAAYLIGPRIELKSRILNGFIPISIGVGVALLYDAVQAHKFNVSLLSFLTSGTTTGYYETISTQIRFGTLLSAHWLGPSLHFLLLFTLFYSIFRVIGIQQKSSVLGAALIALLLFLIGPVLGTKWTNFTPIPIHRWKEAKFSVLLCMPLMYLSYKSPDDLVPKREYILKLLIWATPPLLAWALGAPYENRLLSPAWPPLILLIFTAILPAFLLAAYQHKRLLIVILVSVSAISLTNFENLDGINFVTWRKILALPNSQLLSSNSVRETVLPEFSEMLKIAQPEMGNNDHIFSNDGRLRFFFPGRCRNGLPRKCKSLNGYRIFVFWRKDPGSSQDNRQDGYNFNVTDWTDCDSPPVSLLQNTGDYYIFQVGPSYRKFKEIDIQD